MTPKFTFSGPFGRTAVSLAGPRPYIHTPLRENVTERLALGCYCQHDQERTASLRKRAIGGVVSVYLQCDACGAAIGSAMSRQQHPRWQDYAEWDTQLAKAYDEARRMHLDSLPTYGERNTQRLAEYQARAYDYEIWCRTSPEWRHIAARVAWRSRGFCEACLSASATQVHHLTYEFGKLPPAWHLRAVCDICHTKLHTADNDWCDYGMARDEIKNRDAAE